MIEIFAAGGLLKLWTMQILFFPTVHDDKGEKRNYISLVNHRAVRKEAYEGDAVPTYLCWSILRANANSDLPVKRF